MTRIILTEQLDKIKLWIIMVALVNVIGGDD